MNAANVIKQQKNRIIREWVEKVRKEIPEVNNYSRPFIEDNVPDFLDALVIKIDTGDDQQLIKKSYSHAKERSLSSRYALKNIIREYHLLKETIFEQIDQAKDVPTRDRYTIMHAFHTAIENAADSFFMVRQKMQIDTISALKKKADDLKLEEENREDFVQSISHDLNAPLNNIKACLNLLEEEMDVKHVHQILHILKASTYQAEMLLNDFLDMSMIGSSEKLPLHKNKADVKKELLNEIQIFNLSFQKNVELVCPEKDLYANVDVHVVRRAFSNLLNNAIKHGNPDSPIQASCHIEDKMLHISVRNFGNPIPHKVLDNIFEKYYRINLTKKGWGIGLAFVKEVALAHHGSVNVKSCEKEGTLFELNIPV